MDGGAAWVFDLGKAPDGVEGRRLPIGVMSSLEGGGRQPQEYLRSQSLKVVWYRAQMCGYGRAG